jgi:hypothetical protein
MKCKGTEFCDALKSTLGEPNHKGIALVRTVHLESGEVRYPGVAYKRTERDPGIFFNRCPFCGGNIAPK